MKVFLIKWQARYEDCDELVGIAASEALADKYTKELAAKYPHCYGSQYGHWEYEYFDLIEEEGYENLF